MTILTSEEDLPCCDYSRSGVGLVQDIGRKSRSIYEKSIPSLPCFECFDIASVLWWNDFDFFGNSPCWIDSGEQVSFELSVRP